LFSIYIFLCCLQDVNQPKVFVFTPKTTNEIAVWFFLIIDCRS
jgi:hypothetical protein